MQEGSVVQSVFRCNAAGAVSSVSRRSVEASMHQAHSSRRWHVIFVVLVIYSSAERLAGVLQYGLLFLCGIEIVQEVPVVAVAAIRECFLIPPLTR